MSDSDETIVTAYGRLDKAALLEVQNTYDTRALLAVVEQLNKILAAARGQDGLRDMLLRLHGMTHTVVNGVGLSVATGHETLPELAYDITTEIRELMSTFGRWVQLIEPLEGLQARD
jgi:hypothetical protein